MRVALYYPWIYLPGGPERTFVEILSRSRHSWTLFTNHFDREATFPALRDAHVVELDRVSVKRSFLPVARAAWRIATQRLPLEGYDALVVACDGLGDLALLRNAGTPAACLCFTPLRAAFDEHYRDNYLDRNGGALWRRALVAACAAAFKPVDRRMWRRYRRVLAISGEVRDRIVRGGLRARGDIGLLYPGVDLARLEPAGIRNRDFVVAGRIMWTKNIELAIEAFRRMLARRPELGDFTLTIGGHVDRKSEPYFARLKALAGGDPRIRFRTGLSDEELFALCRQAYALLYPPFNEDWGLIPLEAMALEKPVVAVDRGGPRETVVHGENGLLVASEADAFAKAMETLADDPARVERMGARARVLAERFDWKHFCDGLDRHLEEMVGRRGSPSLALEPDLQEAT